MSGNWQFSFGMRCGVKANRRLAHIRRFTLLVLAPLLSLLSLLLVFNTPGARATFESRLALTIPTRTPTPAPVPTDSDPPQPTNPPPGATNTPEQPAPASTHTPAPAPLTTATSTRPSVAAAEPCGIPPTFQSAAWINVRSGPGLAYPVIAGLAYLETRSIIGRAASSPWWLIELEESQSGWVADSVGTVQGYAGLIPIIEAPAIDGNTPTPGPNWAPTPNPGCTITPTDTPAPEPSATETAQATRSAALRPAIGDSAESPTPTNAPPTETPPSAAVTPPTPMPTSEAEPQNSQPEATPAEEPVQDEATDISDWLLYGGAGLVFVGILFSVVQRFGRPG